MKENFKVFFSSFDNQSSGLSMLVKDLNSNKNKNSFFKYAKFDENVCYFILVEIKIKSFMFSAKLQQ